jgi:hypothetical protein
MIASIAKNSGNGVELKAESEYFFAIKGAAEPKLF